MIREFLRILLWESFQNVAPILGFVYATYQWMQDRKKVALAVIVVSTVIGSLAISVTEPLIYGEPATFAWGVDTLVNLVIFTILAIAVMLYTSQPRRGLGWDLAVSLGSGVIVTVGQALADPFSALAIAAHIVSMSVSFFVFLRCARWAIRIPEDKVVLGRAWLINLLGSAVIVILDYGHLILGME